VCFSLAVCLVRGFAHKMSFETHKPIDIPTSSPSAEFETASIAEFLIARSPSVVKRSDGLLSFQLWSLLKRDEGDLSSATRYQPTPAEVDWCNSLIHERRKAIAIDTTQFFVTAAVSYWLMKPLVGRPVSFLCSFWSGIGIGPLFSNFTRNKFYVREHVGRLLRLPNSPVADASFVMLRKFDPNNIALERATFARPAALFSPALKASEVLSLVPPYATTPSSSQLPLDRTDDLPRRDIKEFIRTVVRESRRISLKPPPFPPLGDIIEEKNSSATTSVASEE